MDPISWALLLGGLGLGQGVVKSLGEGAAADKQKKMNAIITKYSPWTGQHPTQMPQDPNWGGNLFSGGLAGLAFGQNLANQALWSKLLSKNPYALSGPASKILGEDPFGLGG